jgi:hypothetical protein
MMRLDSFKNLVANMPTEYQAFTSSRYIWDLDVKHNDIARAALDAIFGTSREVTLSRRDLRGFASKRDLPQFIMATLIWGYPRGMRGNHFANLMCDLDSITRLLSVARTQPIDEWVPHFAHVKPIVGIGLSTYTKLLCFLSVKVHDQTALILDKRIIDVAKRGIFEELTPLQELTYDNAPRYYPVYLKHMHELASSLEVSAEAIEFFLFEFGLNLKLISA